MTHRDPQDHWRGLGLVVHGRRTRVIVAMLGLLVAFGVPAAVLGVPGLTVDGQPTASPADPGSLGVTGALPGNPLPGDPVAGGRSPGTAVPGDGVPGGAPGAGPPGVLTLPKVPDGPLGIPGVVLGAYQRAERSLAASQPNCRLSWGVLAGIGRIESGHASGGRVDVAGTTLGPILGPRLDGSPGMAAIPDTDRGLLDGDTVWDRAVGPMQFIPSSWRNWGVGSPHNIYDSTLAAGRYLCSGGADLSDPVQLQAAVFRYNHSASYVAAVLQWAQGYRIGVVPVPPAPGPVHQGTNGAGGRPVVTDGAPRAVVPPAAVVQATPLAAPPAPPSSAPAPSSPAPISPGPGSPAPPTFPTTSNPPLTSTMPATTTATPPPTTTTTPSLPPRLPPPTTTTSDTTLTPPTPMPPPPTTAAAK